MGEREVSPGVTLFPARTPTLLPATHTNSYALGGRDLLLVEPATPYEDEQRAWIEWVRGLESAGRHPVAIFATHYHSDHIGGVDLLSRELGLPVWTHDETAQRVGEGVAVRRLVDGDELTLDGPVPQRWRVLETPGHCWGHLCLWEPSTRRLVVGDMVASVGTILIAPGDGDMRVYLEQLGRLIDLDAALALPAHGDPIEAPTQLFEHYVSHRLKREAKVLSAVASAGPSGASDTELVPVAYADTPVASWPFALLSLDAHLEKLVHDGAVVVERGKYRVAQTL